MNSEIFVGALVINPARPDWGPGKIIKLEPQRAYVIWRNVLDHQPKTMIPSALILAKVQRDPYLDSVFEKTVRRNSRPKRERTIRITFRGQSCDVNLLGLQRHISWSLPGRLGAAVTA
jgi:hypothetical protein